jgi:UvrB/uvrC motif
MSERLDISPLLRSWPYEPDNDARIVRSAEGREILQVRTPLGIEQMEMEGRPDGARPHDRESALEFHLQRLTQAKAAGGEKDFELNAKECAELFEEGTLYYFRYVRLFQLKRWTETLRDTQRNLALFDFVRDYARREEDRNNLEKWRPYILRMNGIASALLTLEGGAHEKALKILGATESQIEELEEIEDETFGFERGRSLAALRDLSAQIQQVRPLSPVERLEQQLHGAIDRQEFERAAELRDRIRELKRKQPAG